MNQNQTHPMEAKILIVDDIPANLNVLRQALGPEGYDILATTSGEMALNAARDAKPDLILLDIMMPEMDGFETCRRLKVNPATVNIPVIFITAMDETDSLVEGFQVGGVDYITRPFKKEELLVRVRTHLKIHQLTQELKQKNRELREENARREKAEAERAKAEDALMKADEELSMLSQKEAEHWGVDGFIGKSQTIKRILDDIRQLQEVGTTSVLITGESGTGKELIARAIHFGGTRAKGRFIPLNCPAIPSELVESTLFGHVKGAFTGASEPKKGYFELADGGTLFLDEIGDMPFELQTKLLRVLEDGSFTPVGGTTEKQVDVRVLAATNADLQKKREQGTFRNDLYFRLARFPVEVPPLRERREDIPLLTSHFLKMFATEMGKDEPALSREAMSALQAYHFPGNVRELKSIIEHALILSRGGLIKPEHLHLELPSAEKKDASESRSTIDTPTSITSTQADPGGVQAFLDECCEFHLDAEVRKPELFQEYQQFCKIKKYDPISRNKFYKRILQISPQIQSTLIGEKRLTGFRGLMLKPSSRNS